MYVVVTSFQQDILSLSLPLLESPDYFGITEKALPSVSSDLQFYPIPFAMMLVLCSGFLYDIVGRRKVMFTCFVVSGLMAIISPWLAPSIYPGLLINRIVFTMAVLPL